MKDLLASCRVKKNTEVITNRTGGHRFKPFGKVYTDSLIVCLPLSCRECLKVYALTMLQSKVTWAGF